MPTYNCNYDYKNTEESSLSELRQEDCFSVLFYQNYLSKVILYIDTLNLIKATSYSSENLHLLDKYLEFLTQMGFKVTKKEPVVINGYTDYKYIPIECEVTNNLEARCIVTLLRYIYEPPYSKLVPLFFLLAERYPNHPKINIISLASLSDSFPNGHFFGHCIYPSRMFKSDEDFITQMRAIKGTSGIDRFLMERGASYADYKKLYKQGKHEEILNKYEQ